MGSYYKQQLNEWKASLEVKADVVFDIGGAQSPIKGMTKSWDVNDYKIVDLETPHSGSPKPDIIQDMNQPVVLERTADLIFMLGVMDYVINPNIAMDNIYRMLKKEGTAWVEWPFLYPHHNPVDDEGCRYSYGCIKRLCSQANLNIEEWIWKRPKPGNRYLEMFYAEDGMRAAAGFDHNVTGFITRLSK